MTNTPFEESRGTPDFNDLISLREAAEISDLSSGHLRLLVRRGKLWGKKLGRNWVTTRSAIEDYIAEGHKPGPKPKKTDQSD